MVDFKQLGGHLHEVLQVYWRRSPIAHATKCKTPTLTIQGEDDTVCAMEQAEQFYRILKYNGCAAELLRLRNCSHNSEMDVPSLHRILMDAMKDWFDRFIPMNSAR